MHDLGVLFAVDRAGLVGQDGATHHGYFDVSYLRTLPNMTVMAPGSASELEAMLRFGLELGRPAAVRFPRGEAVEVEGAGEAPLELGKSEKVRDGSRVALFALGDMLKTAIEAADLLEEQGISTAVINARFAKPIDQELLVAQCDGLELVVTIEDNTVVGGYGQAVEDILSRRLRGVPVLIEGLPDSFIEHGSCSELFAMTGLTPGDIAADVSAALVKA